MNHSTYNSMSRVWISTPFGVYGGVAPVIISASRASDIPAFFGDWLMRSLRDGYCVWQNPFNRKSQYIGFQNLRAIVFWTKNPEPFLPNLAELDERNFAYYFQFTLNNYEPENFEPNIPPLKTRIELFQNLSRLLGRHRVIWRFDPIILADGLTATDILERIRFIGEQLAGFTDKLVFSFVDIERYLKVRNRVKFSPLCPREVSVAEMYEIATQLAEQCRRWEIQPAACCENIDFAQFGIYSNRCIDPELLLRLATNDEQLTKFLTQSKKDKGQRKYCGCIASKDIGQYDSCSFNCVYCYANK
ncbi:MAG: DUF1848 domain-containing protein [Planctomycetaceae bacterium]|nr:DUF1848 domain-containing protein [Planctomycetaceae bacterium]